MFFSCNFMGISIANAKLCYSINFFKNPSNYYLIVTDGCISSLFLKLILNQLFVHLNSQFLYCGHSYFFREKKSHSFSWLFWFFYMFKIGLELITIKYIHMTRVEWLYQIIVKKINFFANMLQNNSSWLFLKYILIIYRP